MSIDAGAAIGWFIIVAVVIGGQLLVCGGDMPSQTGNLGAKIYHLTTGTYCVVYPMVNFLLFLVITLPGLVFLFQLLSPFLNNAITGTIVGVASLLAVASFIIGLVA